MSEPKEKPIRVTDYAFNGHSDTCPCDKCSEAVHDAALEHYRALEESREITKIDPKPD